MQKIREGPGSVVGDNTISFPKAYEAFSTGIDSAVSAGVTSAYLISH